MAKKKHKRHNTEINDLIAATGNEFVEELDLDKKKLIYSKDFYVCLYKQLQAGKSNVEAYEALGFDTKKLGTDRAHAACRRALEMAKDDKFAIDPSSYDGSAPREMMGELTPEEEIAYLKARNMWLESIIEYQKKLPSELEEIFTSWNTK